MSDRLDEFAERVGSGMMGIGRDTVDTTYKVIDKLNPLDSFNKKLRGYKAILLKNGGSMTEKERLARRNAIDKLFENSGVTKLSSSDVRRKYFVLAMDEAIKNSNSGLEKNILSAIPDQKVRESFLWDLTGLMPEYGRNNVICALVGAEMVGVLSGSLIFSRSKKSDFRNQLEYLGKKSAKARYEKPKSISDALAWIKQDNIGEYGKDK